jgi:hypothetical protein
VVLKVRFVVLQSVVFSLLVDEVPMIHHYYRHHHYHIRHHHHRNDYMSSKSMQVHSMWKWVQMF